MHLTSSMQAAPTQSKSGSESWDMPTCIYHPRPLTGGTTFTLVETSSTTAQAGAVDGP